MNGRECQRIRVWLGLSRRSFARILGKGAQTLERHTERNGARGLEAILYRQIARARDRGLSPAEVLGVAPSALDGADLVLVLASILRSNHLKRSRGASSESGSR